jgi:hypothetical protein
VSGLEVFVWVLLALFALLVLRFSAAQAREIAAQQALAAGFSRKAADSEAVLVQMREALSRADDRAETAIALADGLQADLTEAWAEKGSLTDIIMLERDRYNALVAEHAAEAAAVGAPEPPVEPLTQAQKDALRANQCLYCGGSHVVAISSCPRIRRMRFRGDGQTPMEVEFWAWGEFPVDGIVLPEEYA